MCRCMWLKICFLKFKGILFMHKIYGMALYEFNVRWRIKHDDVSVAEVIHIQHV